MEKKRIDWPNERFSLEEIREAFERADEIGLTASDRENIFKVVVENLEVIINKR